MRTGIRGIGAAAALALLLLPSAGLAEGFFDDVPRKGYVRGDLSLDVLDAGQGSVVVARVRYLRLALDPGRRDVVWDFWPEREMLLVERATGERVAFERVTKLPAGADPSARRPQGRIGLDGSALETFSRAAAAPGGGACAALDLLIRAGNVEIPVATSDLDAKTVRLGIAKAVETAFSPRERDLVEQTVPILLSAQTQGLPAAPLEMLRILFPGRAFARAAQSLSFRVSSGAPLDPGAGGWRSVTDAPEMLPGAPLY